MTINFNTEPYYDDYDAEKDFYRILYRPGYAVQARELTQMQTILQQQVSRFGDHVFKNGSQVIPGSVNVDNQVHFVKLSADYNGTNILTYLDTFRGKIITGVTSGVKMRVVDTSNCDCVTTDLEIATLYCKIEETAADFETNRLVVGEDIVALEADNTTAINTSLLVDQVGDIYASVATLGNVGETGTTYTNSSSSDVLGYAYGVEVKEGIYYIDGIFVRNPELHLYIGRFNSTPTARVGFKVIEEITTPEADTSLLDNAQGSFNYAAPGAHRYKITVQLVEAAFDSIDEFRFIELLRVEAGRIQHKVEKASYAELEKTLARRTYDESGNYEVNKFKLSVRDHLDNGSNFGVYQPLVGTAVEGITYGDLDKFVVITDPGKAYIAGYEVESVATQYISVDRARENSVTGDEGGHILRVDDQPISTQVGNYVIVKNLYKYPTIQNFQEVYLVSKLVATDGAAPSAADIVGTAKVKSIQLHSSDYSGGDNNEYKIGLVDIQIRTGASFGSHVKSIAGTASSANFTCDIVPDLLNLIGSGSTSTSSPTLTGVGTNFLDYGLEVGDVMYLNGVQVGTVLTVDTNTSITLTANATATVVGGYVQHFHAEIKEPDYNSLVYPVGPQFIKTLLGYDSASQTDILQSTQLTVRRVFSAVNASSSQVEFTISNSYESFQPKSDLSNYLLINQTTNTVVNINTGTITVDPNLRKVTFTGIGNTNPHILIASVLQTVTAGAAKTKSLTSVTQTITGAQNLVGRLIELNKADVLRITRVQMTPGDYTAYDANNSIDITDRFTLDDGQRPAFYTNAKLVLKSGFQVPNGAIKVSMDYFQSGGSGNYFSVDSYVDIEYDEIPNYYITDLDTGRKQQLCLSCSLDFRPIIGGTNTFYNEIPKIGTNVNAPYAYYIGRQDKFVLDSVGRFNIVKGVPAILPQEPEDPKEGLILATIYIPPYTKRVEDIKVYQRDNRRYTMKDIGKLDRRITKLEYYVSLSLLESDTASLQIKDAISGIDKFKNGFIVDNFTGHGIGDVQNIDYRIAVDSSNRVLRPMHYTTALDIVEDLDSGQARATMGYIKSNDVITLPYQEVAYIYNPSSSRTIDVNPYKIGAFKGEVQLLPAGDNWKDTERRPDLQVTDDNNYDAIAFIAEELGVTGTKWDEWETNWTGVSTASSTYRTGNPNQRRQTVRGYEQTVTTFTGTTDREGIETTLNSEVNTQDYGDRVVDVAFTPFMRSRPVGFVAKNLKAGTRFYAFFDSVDVNAYCQPADVFTVTRNSGSAVMTFSQEDLQANVLSDDPLRSYNGEIQPAYVNGDVLVNSEHTATKITSINGGSAFAGGSSFNLVVTSATGILPGHHVKLYNLNFHQAEDTVTLYETAENGVPASIDITSTTATAKELNLKTFKVTAVSGTTLTLANIDGTNVAEFSAYSTSSYSSSAGGMVKRMQASCVVILDGYVNETATDGSITSQDIHVLNIKHGFAIGESLTGSVLIGTSAAKNNVTVAAINGGTDATTAPTLKSLSDSIRTDIDGSTCGIFYIPSNNSVAFRTGERLFKLIDNISNSDADFDSKGSATYYSQGITLTKERTIVNSRTANFVQDRLYESLPVRRTTTSTRLLYSYYTGHDPVAQTFTISSLGGCFVTSVDLFFSETGRRPVTVEIRSTNNGVPSTKVLPFSDVTLSPQQLAISDDGSLPTTFTFKAPIYLQDAETYALIVKTDEPGCQIFISELGKNDIITGNVITSQPLTGALYLSQNSKEFEINPLLDMKFTLRRAEFDVSAPVDVLLRANPPLTYNLPNNPFEITPNTNLIRVYAPKHGFVAGEVVTITGVEDNNYGTASSATGIPASLLNRTHTISNFGIDKDSFIIDLVVEDGDTNSLLEGGVTNADFVKGEYGGSTVMCTRSLNLDALYYKNNDLSFQDTSIRYYVNAEDADGGFTGFQPFVGNSNFFFASRKHICSYDNQSGDPKISSMRIKATISSSNPNVSPLIDLQQLSAYTISNLINNQTAADINVPEIDTRVLLDTLTTADVRSTGTGTISRTSGNAAVTGVSTAFLTQVKAGDKLYKVVGATATLVGIVSTVNSNTSITLTATTGAAASSNSYAIESPPTLSFSNVDGYGVISTNIDTADNLLAGAGVGKHLTIANAHANVNGDYVITEVVVVSDTTTLAANAEQDRINVYVTPAFAGSASIDMITDTDFSISMLEKYVEDFAPIGTHNYANYVTRTLTLAESADSLKIIFDASIVNSTDVKIYYRTWSGEQNLDTLKYVDTGFVNINTEIDGQYTERTVDINQVAPFTNVSIKIVMKSSDPIQVPKIKNLRMIAHS